MTYALFKDGKQVGEEYWAIGLVMGDAVDLGAYKSKCNKYTGAPILKDGYEIREVEG